MNVMGQYFLCFGLILCAIFVILFLVAACAKYDNKLEQEKAIEREKKEKEDRENLERLRRAREEQERIQQEERLRRAREEEEAIKTLSQEIQNIFTYIDKEEKDLIFYCDTLKQYQKLLNRKDFLLETLEDMGFSDKLIQKIKFKQQLKDFFTTNKNPIFNKYKNRISTFITIEYTTPQGRNHYEEDIFLTLEELIAQKEKLKNSPTPNSNLNKFGVSKDQCEIERSKLSAKLRYEVFKRDNYRCKICGRSNAEDGVKLHCDHIVPIAKGGLTELSNLQTLCQDCNLGKGTQDM
jgi:hypothetical protein